MLFWINHVEWERTWGMIHGTFYGRGLELAHTCLYTSYWWQLSHMATTNYKVAERHRETMCPWRYFVNTKKFLPHLPFYQTSMSSFSCKEQFNIFLSQVTQNPIKLKVHHPSISPSSPLTSDINRLLSNEPKVKFSQPIYMIKSRTE